MLSCSKILRTCRDVACIPTIDIGRFALLGRKKVSKKKKVFNTWLEKSKIGVWSEIMRGRAVAVSSLPRKSGKNSPGILTKPTRVRNTENSRFFHRQPTAKNANSLFQRSDCVAKLARIPSRVHRPAFSFLPRTTDQSIPRISLHNE